MSSIYPAHTLTVTEVDGEQAYRLDCDGVTDACRAWDECGSECDRPALDRADEDGDDEPILHGARHRRVSFGWGAATDECWLRQDPEWPEAARDLSLGSGIFRVVHTYEDGGEFYTLALADAEGAAGPP